MPWPLLIQIIAQEGIPVAYLLFQKWQSNQLPTEADFAELRAVGTQRATDRVRARLAANGIPLDSPKAIEILSLVS